MPFWLLIIFGLFTACSGGGGGGSPPPPGRDTPPPPLGTTTDQPDTGGSAGGGSKPPEGGMAEFSKSAPYSNLIRFNEAGQMLIDPAFFPAGTVFDRDQKRITIGLFVLDLSSYDPVFLNEGVILRRPGEGVVIGEMVLTKEAVLSAEDRAPLSLREGEKGPGNKTTFAQLQSAHQSRREERSRCANVLCLGGQTCHGGTGECRCPEGQVFVGAACVAGREEPRRGDGGEAGGGEAGGAAGGGPGAGAPGAGAPADCRPGDVPNNPPKLKPVALVKMALGRGEGRDVRINERTATVELFNTNTFAIALQPTDPENDLIRIEMLAALPQNLFYDADTKTFSNRDPVTNTYQVLEPNRDHLIIGIKVRDNPTRNCALGTVNTWTLRLLVQENQPPRLVGPTLRSIRKQYDNPVFITIDGEDHEHHGISCETSGPLAPGLSLEPLEPNSCRLAVEPRLAKARHTVSLLLRDTEEGVTGSETIVIEVQNNWPPRHFQMRRGADLVRDEDGDNILLVDNLRNGNPFEASNFEAEDPEDGVRPCAPADMEYFRNRLANYHEQTGIFSWAAQASRNPIDFPFVCTDDDGAVTNAILRFHVPVACGEGGEAPQYLGHRVVSGGQAEPVLANEVSIAGTEKPRTIQFVFEDPDRGCGETLSVSFRLISEDPSQPRLDFRGHPVERLPNSLTNDNSITWDRDRITVSRSARKNIYVIEADATDGSHHTAQQLRFNVGNLPPADLRLTYKRENDPGPALEISNQETVMVTRDIGYRIQFYARDEEDGAAGVALNYSLSECRGIPPEGAPLNDFVTSFPVVPQEEPYVCRFAVTDRDREESSLTARFLVRPAPLQVTMQVEGQRESQTIPQQGIDYPTLYRTEPTGKPFTVRVIPAPGFPITIHPVSTHTSIIVGEETVVVRRETPPATYEFAVHNHQNTRVARIVLVVPNLAPTIEFRPPPQRAESLGSRDGVERFRYRMGTAGGIILNFGFQDPDGVLPHNGVELLKINHSANAALVFGGPLGTKFLYQFQWQSPGRDGTGEYDFQITARDSHGGSSVFPFRIEVIR